MSLGSRLKIARKSKHLTQGRLGELTGVTGSAIGNYENGVSSPNEETLIRLMSVLNVDANYLYADDMEAVSGAVFLTPEEERLLSCYRSLNFPGQQSLLTAAESFAANPSLQQAPPAASVS